MNEAAEEEEWEIHQDNAICIETLLQNDVPLRCFLCGNGIVSVSLVSLETPHRWPAHARTRDFMNSKKAYLVYCNYCAPFVN